MGATIQTVSEAYAELVHYTTGSGLKGILESQALWASHSAFLNDPSEIRYFFEARCSTVVTEAILKGIEDGELRPLDKDSAFTDEELRRQVEETATDLTATITSTTKEFNRPFLLSFCGTNDSDIAHDGILSQWRAYGTDGGYAIVFDSSELERRLKDEARAYFYQHMQLGTVFYYRRGSGVEGAEAEIRESEENMKKSTVKFLQDRKPENLEGMYIAVTTLSGLYKHWGFNEEQEVRVIAVHPHETVLEESSYKSRPYRKVNSYLRNGMLVPYLAIFSANEGDSDRKPLPIKRVIVGPHSEAERRAQSVSYLAKELGLNFEVSVSRIPFIGSAS